MRVTDRLLFDGLTKNLQRNASELFRLQNIVSTGKKINKPSDDPVSYSKILEYDELISRSDQYTENIGHAIGFLEVSDSALSGVGDILIRAKELAVAQGNDTMNADDRQSAAIEVQGLFEELVQLANTKLGDRYIFAGYKTQTEPFSTAGVYSGDSGEIMVEVGPDTTIQTNLPGDSLFKGIGGGIDIFTLLNDLKVYLENNDGASVRGSLDSFDTASDIILNGRGDIGGRLNRLDSTMSNTEDLKIEIMNLRSGLEDADIIKAVSDLALQQNVLEASRASSARIIEPTLLDFLR
jgi:flagellar hook-associated protein 3 FlgL